MKVEIIGYMGHPAETKTTKDGQRQFLQFSVAENKQVNGQKVAQWVNVIYNGTKVAQYLVKGCKVFVRGELVAKIYTKKDGTSAIDLTMLANEETSECEMNQWIVAAAKLVGKCLQESKNGKVSTYMNMLEAIDK